MSIRIQFASASPGRQAAIVVLGVALLGAIIALAYYYLLRTDYRPAFSGLQPADAATIVGELEKRKLPYQLSDGGRVILLPADRADAIRLEIMGTDLPLKGTVGFELFNKSDMGLTDFAQKINYQRALQGELARTILALENVESVRVHLALGEDRLFRQDQVAPKASVLVRMKNEAAIPASTAQGIQQLIAAAVDKLDPANVVILGETGQVASVVTPAASSADSSALGQEKRAIEAFYEARIHKAIETAYPREPVTIQVWADMRQDQNAMEGRVDASGWSPENRKFRLHVNLAPARSMAPGARQDIESLAASAVGLDPALGDVISFGAAPLAPVAAPIAAPHFGEPSRQGGEDGIEAAETGSAPTMAQILSMIAGALLLGGLATSFLLRHRGRLDSQARSDFADRLTQLLHEEERNHVG
jgi:flagellar M-ring protein FliF